MESEGDPDESRPGLPRLAMAPSASDEDDEDNLAATLTSGLSGPGLADLGLLLPPLPGRRWGGPAAGSESVRISTASDLAERQEMAGTGEQVDKDTGASEGARGRLEKNRDFIIAT